LEFFESLDMSVLLGFYFWSNLTIFKFCLE
jgi:hypothetical protein